MIGWLVAVAAFLVLIALISLGFALERDWQAGGLAGLELYACYVIPAATVGGAATAVVLLWRRV